MAYLLENESTKEVTTCNGTEIQLSKEAKYRGIIFELSYLKIAWCNLNCKMELWLRKRSKRALMKQLRRVQRLEYTSTESANLEEEWRSSLMLLVIIVIIALYLKIIFEVFSNRIRLQFSIFPKLLPTCQWVWYQYFWYCKKLATSSLNCVVDLRVFTRELKMFDIFI